MADIKHVVLIHGTWLRGDSWADTRAEFEQRGYTVHTPTLRFHDLPFEEGAKKVGPVSLRDYADDLAALVEALDSPPLLIGHSLGGLIAQLAAARTRHAGVVAACTAPAAGIFSMYPSTARIFLPHYLQSRPWDKPLYPTTWKLFRSNISNTHTEEAALEERFARLEKEQAELREKSASLRSAATFARTRLEQAGAARRQAAGTSSAERMIRWAVEPALQAALSSRGRRSGGRRDRRRCGSGPASPPRSPMSPSGSRTGSPIASSRTPAPQWNSPTAFTRFPTIKSRR